MKNINLILTLLSLSFVLESCGESSIITHRRVDFFTWTQNSSTVVAIAVNFNTNPNSDDIITFDTSANELSKIHLPIGINDRTLPRTNKLFLLPDQQTIIDQKGNEIVSINTMTGLSNILVSGRILIDVSPSRTLLFSIKNTTFILSKIEGSKITDLHQFALEFTDGSYPSFITDSLWCIVKTPKILPGDTCKLLIFDTAINHIKTYDDCLIPYSYAVSSKELATLNADKLVIVNIQTDLKKEILLASNASFSKISSDGKIIYYVSGSEQPYLLHKVQLDTGSDSVIANDVVTDIQLSTDDKSLTYFAYVAKDIKLRVVQVK